MNATKRIGLIGGTFDPIHMGHLIAAEWARDAFALERVIFIPAGDPPHKELAAVTDAQHRYVMTMLATLTNPHFSVSRVELDREGKSFTYDTLSFFREQWGSDVDLFFIMGADSLADLPNWHRPQEIVQLAQLIVATRPDWDFEAALKALGKEFEPLIERIHRLDIPEIGIAGRHMRERVEAGATIKYMTPDIVVRYIESHGLYGGKAGDSNDLS